MKKKISVLATLFLFIMPFSMNVFASSGSGQITVGKDYIFVTGVSGVTRTGAYRAVLVKADSVYPVGVYNEDNFKRCKTRLYMNDSTSTPISDSYTLREGQGYVSVELYDGCLNLHWFNICFAGNNPDYGAVIDFTYDGQ